MAEPAAAPKEIKLAPYIPTLTRAASIWGVVPDKVKKKCEDLLSALSENLREKAASYIPADEAKLKAYEDVRRALEGQIPIPDEIDFNKVASVDGVVENTLKIMLGDEEKRKKKLKDAEVADADAMIEQIRALIKTRLLLNVMGPINLDKINGELDKYIKDLEGNEKHFKDVMEKGAEGGKILQAKIEAKKFDFSDEELKTLKSIPVKGVDGLCVTRLKGDLFCVVDNWKNPREIISGVIKTLAHKKEITWYNIPKKAEGAKKEAEIACLQQWKKVKFVDHGKPEQESALSACMPERPGAWTEWLKNIEQNRGGFFGDAVVLRKELIEKVVNGEAKLLKEFWKDLNRNGDEKMRQDIYERLSDQQKEILLTENAKELNDFVKRKQELVSKPKDQPNDALLKSDFVHCDAQLSEVIMHYAEFLSRKYEPSGLFGAKKYKIDKAKEEVKREMGKNEVPQELSDRIMAQVEKVFEAKDEKGVEHAPVTPNLDA